MSLPSRVTVKVTIEDNLTPSIFRAKVALQSAQASIKALSGDPADRAWAEVMDALYDWVRSSPEGSP